MTGLPINALLLLLSTFVLVFALGLQSQIARDGHYFYAALNSIVIGSTNLVMLKLAPDANNLEMAAYVLGGPIGIVSSMFFYRYIKK